MFITINQISYLKIKLYSYIEKVNEIIITPQIKNKTRNALYNIFLTQFITYINNKHHSGQLVYVSLIYENKTGNYTEKSSPKT